MNNNAIDVRALEIVNDMMDEVNALKHGEHMVSLEPNQETAYRLARILAEKETQHNQNFSF